MNKYSKNFIKYSKEYVYPSNIVIPDDYTNILGHENIWKARGLYKHLKTV